MQKYNGKILWGDDQKIIYLEEKRKTIISKINFKIHR